MKQYRLYELQNFIRRILAANLNERVWIVAEIAQCKEARGHWYLDLVEKSADGNIAAQASAVLWSNTHSLLAKKLKNVLPELLRQGVQLLLEVNVEFHERYGMKLVIQDIDAAYTYGQLELERRKTHDKLAAEGDFRRNKSLDLPLSLQRIAVLAASQSAGYQDFVQHLQENTAGYRFELSLFETAVQGDLVQADFCRHLKTIERQKERFDAVCILRGGGSRMDLVAFDGYEICKMAADCPLPILTGIGHEIDTSLLDLVAHTCLKTPTALAGFLLEHQSALEERFLVCKEHIKQAVWRHLKEKEQELQQVYFRLSKNSQEQVWELKTLLQKMELTIHQQIKWQLVQQNQALTQTEHSLRLLDPKQVLKRGFAMVSQGNKVIVSTKDLGKGDVLSIRLQDGSLQTIVSDL